MAANFHAHGCVCGGRALFLEALELLRAAELLKVSRALAYRIDLLLRRHKPRRHILLLLLRGRRHLVQARELLEEEYLLQHQRVAAQRLHVAAHALQLAPRALERLVGVQEGREGVVVPLLGLLAAR